MKPYEKYPSTIKWQDKEYELDLSYKAVFLVFDVLNDEQLSFADKCGVALNIFIKEEHPYNIDLLEAIFNLLELDKKSDANEEKVIDIYKDFPYIVSSFRQAYGIDIVRDNIHYLEFIYLLQGIPSNTKIVDVINIRRTKVPEYDGYNAEYINNLLELKSLYSLNEKSTFNDGLSKLFNVMKGGVNNGSWR